MNVSITIQDAEVQALLKRLQDKVGNLKPAMEEIGQRYERSVLENFAAERSPDGTPWAKLSATTLMLGLGKKKGFKKSGFLSAKGKGYLQSKKLLFTTGEMFKRVHHQADNSSVTIGNAARANKSGYPYPAVHQFGSNKAGRGNKTKIPARPWLAVNRGESLELAAKDKAMVLEVLEKHLNTP